MRNFLIMFCISLAFSACQKGPGEGGTSVIEGQVYKIFTFQNPTTGLLDTTYFELDSGKDVFIIYSNDSLSVYDDKFETDFNGRYRFEFLRKGGYTLYTYADSTEQITEELSLKYPYPVFKKINVGSNNSTIKVDDFIIQENQ